MADDAKTHWQTVYSKKASTEVSWYQEEPTTSLRLIASAKLGKEDAILDVGGGASTLADHLLEQGYSDLSVLDLSTSALKTVRERLGDRAKAIEWIEADIRNFETQKRYSLWHDRAVFHFLTEEADRAAYKAALVKALLSGGHFIIATFALDGPKQCSGLNISQYDATSLERTFQSHFALLHSEKEIHRTPWGSEQRFIYCHFRRKEPGV